MSRTAPSCDIFCAVVDNYGDAAVCWRLARQLADEHGWRVRLWIDDPAPLSLLAPDHAASAVKVRLWAPAWEEVPAAEVVIEAFACELPPAYVEAMARQAQTPVWINLEYLSAEAWVAGCHGLPSPHPRLPLVKHFFFPGFDAACGGLLREAGYDARRATFDEAAFRAEFGIPPRQAGELTITLFSYPHAPLAPLLCAWRKANHPVTLLLPGATTGGDSGTLKQVPLPFLPQPRFDELLWASDLNFVRGEDSFVRAQWAARPFVWHIYPQEGDVHLQKLDAFLARHPAGELLRPFWRAWNGAGRLDWEEFSASLAAQSKAARVWAATLKGQAELTRCLVEFCQPKLK